MIYKNQKRTFSKLDQLFSKKSRKISNVGKVIYIFASVLIFWLGIWKIHTDMNRVLSKVSYNSDIWIEIIESLDILVFITMVIIVSLENIFKEKNICVEMKNFTLTRDGNSLYFLIVTNLLFYGCLIFIIVFQHLLADARKDYAQFLLSLSTQYYLLSMELDFVMIITEIKTYFASINSLLKKSLTQPTPIGWIQVESKSNTFDIEDCTNLHWVVCRYVNKINYEYSLRLLSLIICIFYKLMFIPYLSSLNLIKAYSENLAKELSHVSLLIFHFAELLVVACSADSANCEAEKTRLIICECLKFHTRNEEIDVIERQLNSLSVHNAELKIFNLFKLNRPFILSIFGAVITYMVIFIQLQDALNISQISF